MKTRHTLTALGVVALAGLVWAAAPLLAEHPFGGPPPSWEELTERHDADGDGRVSAEELFGDHFDRLDADGDGFVTAADFEAHRSTMAFTFVAHRADADQDGDVTAAELDAWFAERDTNGDDRLDASDFEKRGAGGPRPHFGNAFALDADGDDAVTRSDLEALAARFDADGDGVVAADELPEMGPGHHGRFHHRGPGGPGPHRGPGR
jgi:Ca2+-binding EF-hand superfamily protein